jgi:hypothetical protein
MMPAAQSRLKLAPARQRLAFDGDSTWVVNRGDNTVIRMPLGSGPETFRVGFNPSAIAFDGANVWVASWNEGSVSKL